MNARLTGSVVLVTGATGHVGWGIATAAAAAGAHLILPVRSERSADVARADFPNADVVLADLGSSHPDPIDAIAEAIERTGRLDHVAAPIGSWWQGGATVAQPSRVAGDLLDTYVIAQHRTLRATIDALRASGGSYTMVTGAGGEFLVPDAGLLVVAVRSQYALAEVLRRELADDPARFNELRIDTRVEREPRRGVVASAQAGEAFVDLMVSDLRSELVRFGT
jgi:NAD(P)-dependent dehydrogenase (short-subunit alcohol dehydrogenase family)